MMDERRIVFREAGTGSSQAGASTWMLRIA